MFTIFTPEQINEGIKFSVNLFLLILGTSVGTFTRELIFPKQNNFGENLGFCLFSGITVFGILLRFPTLSLEYSFLLCFFIGFFLPSFKNWFKDKQIFRMIFKIASVTKSTTDAVIETISEELEKEQQASEEAEDKKGE